MLIKKMCGLSITATLGLLISNHQAGSVETIQEFNVPGSEIPAKLCKVLNTEDSIVQEVLDAHNEGLIHFHKADIEQEPNVDQAEMLKQDDFSLLRARCAFSIDEFKSGRMLLAVSYHGDKLVLGSYHAWLENEATVFMRGTWFDRSASPVVIGPAIQQLIHYMASTQHFPDAKKIVVVMRENSTDNHQLVKLGFERDMDFKISEGKTAKGDVNCVAFKKTIVRN